ncbi:MAG: dienelactone hydrolase family protein [Bacteroidota bacterium]|nr:dienelactone hydrolase family protein [Bacteroidota bacterium]
MKHIFFLILLIYLFFSASGQLSGLSINGDPESATGAKWNYISTESGVNFDLEGILLKPKGDGPFPAVIISHGKGGNAYGYSQTIAKEMVKWGYVCIATNYTHSKDVPVGQPGTSDPVNFGASAVNIQRAMKCYDILTHLNYVDRSSIMAFGHSMGAFLTIGLTGSHPQKFIAAGHTAGGVDDDKAAPSSEAASGITIPYIIHHGEADPVVKLPMALKLDSILGENGTKHELFIYPDFNHNQIRYDSMMLQRTKKWFNQHLKNAKPKSSAVNVEGQFNNSALRKARNPKSGLLFYAKSYFATDTTVIKNPNIVGALFQIIWSEVEKKDGEYDWSEVEAWMRPWLSAGKKVAFRIMWSTSGYWPREFYKHPTPQWVWEKGAKFSYHEVSKTEIPLPWDPIYKNYALRFMKEVATRFESNPGILFIDVTPGAETNPFRFGTIRRQDPSFEPKYLKTAASNGKAYTEDLWMSTVKDYIDSTARIFTKIPALVTLNAGGLAKNDNSNEIGWYATNKGMFVGQNGLGKNSYLKDDSRRRAFAQLDPHTKFFFEMVDRSGVGNTGTLMEVMKAAERINCSYLNVYPEDVLKGTKGNAEYDSAFEEALKYGASIIGKTVTIPSGIDSLFGRKIFTYEQSADLRKLETLYKESQEKKYRKGRFINYIRAETDGSIQPVGMYVPEDYVSSKKYPLVLQLHGIGPKFIGGIRASWTGMKYEDWIDPSLGVIYVQAYARQNSGYRGIAESELLQILSEVKLDYSIDPDRIYIIGHSMGGAGTLNFALHHPDMFAACTAIDAALGAADLNENSTLQWLSFQSNAFNPDSVAMNAYNLPMFFHTADGALKVAQYRLSEIMKQNGCINVSIETHKGMPHHFAKFIPYHTFIIEMLKYKRNSNPAQIKFKTYSLKYNKAYWLTIEGLQRRDRPISVDAKKNNHEISITTSNISSLKLQLFPNEEITDIVVDGSKLKVSASTPEIFLENKSQKWVIVKVLSSIQPAPSIGQVIETPFLIVYGDTSDFKLAHSTVDAIINPMGKRTVTVGDFPFKSYKELSLEDKKTYNLILFGTAESNPLIASYQNKFPIQVNKDKVKMNRETFNGQGTSAVFISPNPLNASRSIVVWSGALHNLKLITDNSAFFTTILPEYIIFNDSAILKAGFYRAY